MSLRNYFFGCEEKSTLFNSTSRVGPLKSHQLKQLFHKEALLFVLFKLENQIIFYHYSPRIKYTPQIKHNYYN